MDNLDVIMIFIDIIMDKLFYQYIYGYYVFLVGLFLFFLVTIADSLVYPGMKVNFFVCHM